MTEYHFAWSWGRAVLEGDRRRLDVERLPERVRAAVDTAVGAGSWEELLRTRRAGAPEPEVGEETVGRRS